MFHMEHWYSFPGRIRVEREACRTLTADKGGVNDGFYGFDGLGRFE
jgi:hypothetical protein